MGKRLILTHLGLSAEDDFRDSLLLGAWCLAGHPLLDEHADGVQVLRHPWHDAERLESDYARIENLYVRSLECLSRQLNKLHGVDISPRGWEIFLGTWLRTFLNCAYERTLLLEAAIDQHGISRIKSASPNNARCLDNTASFVLAVQRADWNEMFLVDVLAAAFPDSRIPLEPTLDPERKVQGHQRNRPGVANRAKSAALSVLTGIDAFFARNAKVFLHRTGMDLRREIAMMLRARMVPHFFLPRLAKGDGPPDPRRGELLLGLGDSNYERAMQQLLTQYLPRVFVEDFSSAKDLVSTRYPRKPRLIITGVSYYSDDCFKLFAAIKIQSGTKYVVLQHGGNFGVGRFNDEEDLILNTADAFFTWGWRQDQERAFARKVPFPSLLLGALPKIRSDPAGNIVIPVSEWTLQLFRLFSAPMSFRQLEHIEEIACFWLSLPENTRQLVRLRLQPHDRGWMVKERLVAAGLGENILSTPGRFVTDLANARLAVVTTNSTSMLESLVLNIPTVIIVNEQHWPIKASVEDDYRDLELAGILYRDAGAAARHVSRVLEDTGAWWQSAQVQSARARFVARYALTSGDVLTDVKSSLERALTSPAPDGAHGQPAA